MRDEHVFGFGRIRYSGKKARTTDNNNLRSITKNHEASEGEEVRYLKRQGCQEGDGVEQSQKLYVNRRMWHKQICENQVETTKMSNREKSRFSGKKRTETKLTIRDYNDKYKNQINNYVVCLSINELTQQRAKLVCVSKGSRSRMWKHISNEKINSWSIM